MGWKWEHKNGSLEMKREKEWRTRWNGEEKRVNVNEMKKVEMVAVPLLERKQGLFSLARHLFFPTNQATTTTNHYRQHHLN
ncbi:hypothetical protein VNO77_41217 [Canavalia gladiata]|uniref:Uncharacterized protein n=1 Tax=Canavalia gladiata TaxID=3824 RepID=A0AAN9PRX9_CANGL